jgi:macrolide-specific efflux system membrane fusion protein
MAQSRTSRRTALAVGAVVVVIGIGVGIAIAASGSGGSTSTRVQTSVATTGNLAQTVDVSYTLGLGTMSTLAYPASGTTVPSSGGVVTKVDLAVGAAVPTLAPLIEVNGYPVYGIPTSVPFFRSLVEGNFGPDVQALQDALNATGYSTFGDQPAVFGLSTLNALEAWQTNHLAPVTGSMSLTYFTSFPANAVAISLTATQGSAAAPGGAIATVGNPAVLVAQADVPQADVSSVKVGQVVSLSFDALSGVTENGFVGGLPAQAETATGSTTAGNSNPVQYSVTIAVPQIPSGARAGMTGQAHIAVQSVTGAVLVPSGAVGGSTTAPTVVVLVNGHQVTRPVQVGLVTSTQTQILAGVQAGDVVVTGTQQLGSVTTAATAATSGGGGGGLGGGGGGLGGGGGGLGGGVRGG